MTEASGSDPARAQLQRQLDAARAELQDLTYTVSHDLRAPLRHINAYAQIIQEDWPDMPADVAGHLTTIRQSAQLLAQQIDGLTQLSRLSLQPVDLQPVDVNVMAHAVADELSALHPQHAVQWQLARDVPLVLADAALLRQVLAHVLDNALKFSRGSEPAQVALTWQTVQADRCRVCITDQGVGFVPEQADQLFKVFAKLHPAREFAGLGLGLVTSRKIMDRLGGAIAIEGAVGQGCRVTLDMSMATQ